MSRHFATCHVKYNFKWKTQWIASEANVLPDALSRYGEQSDQLEIRNPVGRHTTPEMFSFNFGIFWRSDGLPGGRIKLAVAALLGWFHQPGPLHRVQGQLSHRRDLDAPHLRPLQQWHSRSREACFSTPVQSGLSTCGSGWIVPLQHSTAPSTWWPGPSGRWNSVVIGEPFLWLHWSSRNSFSPTTRSSELITK